MRRLVDESALSSHTDGREDIITSAHDRPDVSPLQLLNDRRGRWLEFVLKDDEAYKLKIALGFFSLHLLHLEPIDFERLCGARNDTETFVRVKGQ